VTVTLRLKKDRSPSYPFISLRRAVERAQQFSQAHKRDAARLAAVAPTWSYGSKSSGLLQTAAALKQYGLIEDVGSGDERKLRLTELARKILSDTRPGVKESALREAANKPKLFSEYIERWVPDMPADSHCISELEHDRGFTPDAAKLFLKAFKITVNYAGLRDRDSGSPGATQSADVENEDMQEAVEAGRAPSPHPVAAADAVGPLTLPTLPFSQRLKVEMTVGALRVTATLVSPSEVDRLIQFLEANKLLLTESNGTA
jgi:hypothetical protein